MGDECEPAGPGQRSRADGVVEQRPSDAAAAPVSVPDEVIEPRVVPVVGGQDRPGEPGDLPVVLRDPDDVRPADNTPDATPAWTATSAKNSVSSASA